MDFFLMCVGLAIVCVGMSVGDYFAAKGRARAARKKDNDDE